MLHITKADRQFVETGFPGIRMAVIWGENSEGAEFHEFKAGARFPLHHHKVPEQVLVLSGRMRFGDFVLTAGDYLRFDDGDAHDAEALEDSIFFLAHLDAPIFDESRQSA